MPWDGPTVSRMQVLGDAKGSLIELELGNAGIDVCSTSK